MIVLTEEHKNKARLETRGNFSSDKFWINIDGKDYLFKVNPENSFYEYDYRLDFGERLYSKISKKLKFNCVNTTFATCPIEDVEKNGVLVESYLTSPEMQSINYNNLVNAFGKHNAPLSVESCIKIIKGYASKYDLRFNDKETKTEMYKRVILDFFLAQLDRHKGNIEFLIDNNTISIAPSFDNGKCLGFDYSSNECQSILRQISKGTYVGELAANIFFFGDKGYKLAQKKIYTKYIQDIIFQETVEICEREPEVKEFLKDLLALDMKAEIEGLEQERGSKLKEEMKTCSLTVWEEKKRDFKIFLKCKTKGSDLLKSEPSNEPTM